MARKPAWRSLLLLVVLSVFAGMVEPIAAAPVGAAPVVRATAQDPPPTDPRPIPHTPYPGWDGQTGLGEVLNQQLRWLVVENAEKSEDFEIRDVALAALAENTNAAFRRFLVTDRPAAAARAKARREATARQNRTTIEALDGTGGPVFNAEVDRVLAGSDYDREIFLMYGKEIATERDDRARRAAEARADELRVRVTVLAATAGPEVQRAAREALAAGDAAVAAFLNGGYLEAAKRDAVAREQYLKDLEERTKAAEQLSEVAKRAARASEARKNLLIAHGEGVRALQRSSNGMVSASNAARQAVQILVANEASGHHSPESFRPAQEEVNRQLGYARAAATDARNASVAARTQADILIEIELPYGADWARMAEGMGAAARAAELATETAQQAVVATMATDAARNDQEKAEARAEQARRWRTHGEEHARATAGLAEAARLHAVAGADAAARTRDARIDAEQAERIARFHADEAQRQMETAERERAKAAEARQIAEAERAKAEQYRKQAEAEAVVARNARAEAERQARVAEEYERRAVAQEGVSASALAATLEEERKAMVARDEAIVAERNKDIAEAKAQALEHAEAMARGTQHEAAAHAAAVQARLDANGASAAARNARNAANIASGAAARSREYAVLAEGAAKRARAAAEDARWHAAKASEAASKAEHEAALTHHAATQANAAAAEATAAEAQAAHHAREAVRLAEMAVVQATAAALASERSKAESDAANHEAVSAVTQSGLTGRAALGARFSAAAITDPANTAIVVVAPFTGSDLDADWIAEVARQAQGIGDEHAAAAQVRANEARAAAVLAQQAADRAEGEAKAAFQAAANAAQSAANAQQSAADAQKSAAEAAKDGAKAREAAAAANQHDAAAHESATRARQSANAANEDAAIAGRSADQAAQDATAARGAATQAGLDAKAAEDAAGRAEAAAARAQAAAEQAQRNADEATASMERARQAGIEIQEAIDRLEQQQRNEEAERRKREADELARCFPELSVEDAEQLAADEEEQSTLTEYRQLLQECSQGGFVSQFLLEIGAEVLLEVLGINDLIRCFGDGNIEACLWTLVNVLSFAVIVLKAIPIGKAIIAIVVNIGKYFAKSERIQGIVKKVRDVLARLQNFCAWFSAVAGARSTGDGAQISSDFSCGTIAYDSDMLSIAAVEVRIMTNYGMNGRNVAVAHVDGWVHTGPNAAELNRKFPNMVFGRSGANGNQNYHSEDDIFDQLKRAGVSTDKVNALYTERAPCSRCANRIKEELKNNKRAKISWSVPYGKNAEDKRLFNETLLDFIEAAFRRRGIFGKSDQQPATEPVSSRIVLPEGSPPGRPIRINGGVTFVQ